MAKRPQYIVGVFRKGTLLFRLGGIYPDYKTAASMCMLIEAFYPPLTAGDYIACDHKETT